MNEERVKRASELALAGKDGEALALLRSDESAHRQPASVDASFEELLLRFVAAGDPFTPRELLRDRHPAETAPLYALFQPQHNLHPPLDAKRVAALVEQHPIEPHALLIGLMWFRLPRGVTQALARWRLGDASDTEVIQTVVHVSQKGTQRVRELALALPIVTPLRELSPVGDGVHFDSTAGLVAMMLVSLIVTIAWINC